MSKAQVKAKRPQLEEEPEEEEVTVKKQKNQSGAKAIIKEKALKSKKPQDDEDSNEEEIILPSTKGKTAQKAEQKAIGKGKAIKADQDTSDTSEDEIVVKTSANKKTTVTPPSKQQSATKGKPKPQQEEDSDEEEETTTLNTPLKKKGEVVDKKAQKSNEKATTSAQAKKKAAPMDLEEDEDEEEAPVKNKLAATKGTPVNTKQAKGKKVIEEEEEEDEEEEVQEKATQNQKFSTPKQEEGGKNFGNHEVFVKNLPFNATEADISAFFEDCGTIEGVNLLKGYDGRSKGIAFVKFPSEEGVQKAVDLNGSDYEGRALLIEKTIPKDKRPAAGSERPKSERDPSSSSIFIGNLSYSVTEESLRQLFEPCGKIKEVRVAMDQEGNARGFAHLEFMSPDAVEKAIQKAGSKLDGRAIRVDYSTNKKQDGGNRHGGGGRNFGGGNYGGGNYGGGNFGGRNGGGYNKRY